MYISCSRTGNQTANINCSATFKKAHQSPENLSLRPEIHFNFVTPAKQPLNWTTGQQGLLELRDVRLDEKTQLLS